MIVRELAKIEEDDVRDAVRVLILSFEKELFAIFRDLELAREIFFEFFEKRRDGCYAAVEERVIGFASASFKPNFFAKKLGLSASDLRPILKSKLGFFEGIKASLLLSYLCPNPKAGEGVINFLAVSPLRRYHGVGSSLLERIIADAENAGVRKLKCYVSIENDGGIALLTKYGFGIEKMLDNSFAEKRFGQRRWYLMSLGL